MAIITITINEGRETEVKNRLIAGITDVCVKELKAKPHQVRVLINELAKGNYAVAGKPV